MYYNNRGVETMANGNNTKAFLYFRKAIDLNPNAHFIWSNLGVLYQRGEQLELAESAFRHALSFGKLEPLSGGNLARIYRSKGKHEEAEALELAIQGVLNRNPYFKYKMAVHAYTEGDTKSALTIISSAITLKKD